MREEKNCLYCGKLFMPSRPEGIYCSKSCSCSARNKVMAKPKAKCVCEQCGKEFETEHCYLKRGGGRFCSDSCATTYRNLKNNPTRKPEVRAKIKANHADFKGEKHPRYTECVKSICIVCGKEFTHKPRYNRKVCSRSCGVTHRNLTVGSPMTKPEIRARHSKLMTEKTKQNPGSVPMTKYKGGKRKDLGDKYFRSTWEANFARIMEYEGKTYSYETKSFEIKIGEEIKYYLPDFLVDNTYYEIKGYWYEDARAKFNAFLDQYPEIQIKVIDRKEYTLLEEKYKTLIPNWE